MPIFGSQEVGRFVQAVLDKGQVKQIEFILMFYILGDHDRIMTE